MHKRLAALILCSIAILCFISMDNNKHSKRNPKPAGASGDTATDDNFVPNIGAPSIVVPDDYPNISLAVAHAKSGDVIFVKQ